MVVSTILVKWVLRLEHFPDGSDSRNMNMSVVSNGSPIAYQIAVTYQCNAACHRCVQHLDVIRWDHIDTDITTEEIRVGAHFVKKYGLQIGKLRVTGGEPMVHPKLREILNEIHKEWTPRSSWFRIYSNGKLPILRKVPGRWSVVPVTSDKKKTENFVPFNVSPADLGIEPVHGFTRECVQETRCGRWFDCFGFTFCGVAGVLGAMLGVDCYEPLPVLMGRPSVCQHCLYSLPSRERDQIRKKVNAGVIPEVTKTFKEAIERWHDDPPKPRRFLERLPKEYLPGEKADEGHVVRDPKGRSPLLA